MVHAMTEGDLRALAAQAASTPANAQAVAALVDLVETIVRNRRAAATSAPTTAVLIKLAKLGPARVGDLAAELHLDQSTVSRHLANLDEAGLIARTVDPTDRRAQLAGLTAAGWAQVQAAVATRVQVMEQVLDDWTDADRLALAELLTRFTHRLSHLTEGIRT